MYPKPLCMLNHLFCELMLSLSSLCLQIENICKDNNTDESFYNPLRESTEEREIALKISCKFKYPIALAQTLFFYDKNMRSCKKYIFLPLSLLYLYKYKIDEITDNVTVPEAQAYSFLYFPKRDSNYRCYCKVYHLYFIE